MSNLERRQGERRTGRERRTGDIGPPPCNIWYMDGAWKCSTHNRLWGAVTNPDEPCDGWEEPSDE
jgi:hypothetical protein